MQAGLSLIDIENFWGDYLSQKARSTHETRGSWLTNLAKLRLSVNFSFTHSVPYIVQTSFLPYLVVILFWKIKVFQSLKWTMVGKGPEIKG